MTSGRTFTPVVFPSNNSADPQTRSATGSSGHANSRACHAAIASSGPTSYVGSHPPGALSDEGAAADVRAPRAAATPALNPSPATPAISVFHMTTQPLRTRRTRSSMTTSPTGVRRAVMLPF